MVQSPHLFSIPVMGTGHSIDSPIRVAPFGIDSVISVVDDLLVERIRKHYCSLYDLEFISIPRNAIDGRAKRITAYLETVRHIVELRFDQIKSESFFSKSDKARYFEMLPDGSVLKKAYHRLLKMDAGEKRNEFARELTSKMIPGAIDVNIMAKVDFLKKDKLGNILAAKWSDANAALRGYAFSNISSSLVLSAGFNPRLYNYLAEFKDFYRTSTGDIKKKIILKVSDFRSALIQGKYLAKKGLEVWEYRIESGLNCGGHAFASDGHLLPSLLNEFKEKKEQLTKIIHPLIQKYYEDAGLEFNAEWHLDPKVTVQGGVGSHGETKRLMHDFGMDGTGWGSPFLMVPEATAVDEPTRSLLADANEEDLYLSGVSPLGVPFNNIRNSGSEKWHNERIAKDKPGSGCPKGYLKLNTEFTEEPICTASTQYQLLKIDEIRNNSSLVAEVKEKEISKVQGKACLCDHLGNGALMDLGIIKSHQGPQAVCPGPNIAWFNRDYSLQEMIDHIYGRGDSLVSEERPHMFAKELIMYVDYLEQMISNSADVEAEKRKFKSFISNLESGIDLCRTISDNDCYEGENLESLSNTVVEQSERLSEIKEQLSLG